MHSASLCRFGYDYHSIVTLPASGPLLHAALYMFTPSARNAIPATPARFVHRF